MMSLPAYQSSMMNLWNSKENKPSLNAYKELSDVLYEREYDNHTQNHGFWSVSNRLQGPQHIHNMLIETINRKKSFILALKTNLKKKFKSF